VIYSVKVGCDADELLLVMAEVFMIVKERIVSGVSLIVCFVLIWFRKKKGRKAAF